METKKIDLFEFVPQKVVCGKNQKEYPLNINCDDHYMMISYIVNTANQIGFCGRKEHSLTIPRYINWNLETFDVLGLLQAEMGKTNNGCIVFCNHEHRLVNKVMKWFERELELMCNRWRWYIKVNINEPEDKNYKNEIEKKVITHWLSKTKIDPTKRHPKTVSYIKNTKNKRLKYYDYGTLIIEHKSNLLSQIIKKYVREMSFKVPLLDAESVSGFLRGIIAGESNVEVYKPDKRYRVYISSIKKEELVLYQRCLANLGVHSKQYQNDKIIISKRENNIKLLKQRLMCLSPEKYSKFLNMIKLYRNFWGIEEWKKSSMKPWNKIPQEKINQILELCKQNPNLACWKIAKEAGVSTIKVARIKKEHNLGKRLNKTSKETIERVIELHNKNPSAYAYGIANWLGIHKSRVERIRRKYGLVRKTPTLTIS